MALEIERRFLVKNAGWHGLAPAVVYRQGYMSVDPARTVRVRVVGAHAWLTIKSQISHSVRYEFEYEIPLEDAETMLETMCPMVVEKHRHRIEFGGFIWEVDEFFGENAGLVLAEIELPAEDTPFEQPDWIGEEVTQDSRYTNAYLSTYPFTRWH